jgi:hypothetical protein
MGVNDFLIPYAGASDRKTTAILRGYLKRKKFAYDVSGNIQYLGVNWRPGAASADTDWEIHKFGYDASDNITDFQILPGSWDGRVALSWDF